MDAVSRRERLVFRGKRQDAMAEVALGLPGADVTVHTGFTGPRIRSLTIL